MASRILQEDIDSFSLPEDLKEKLRDSTIIVTGATGLIGSALVRCVSALDIGVKFILPVRNPEKAARLFSDCGDRVSFTQAGLADFFLTAPVCDYIVNCASPTNGKYMSEHPAETFMLPIETSHALLDYSLRMKGVHDVKGIVFLSSIEYYGRMSGEETVREDAMGYIDRESPRSSYALGKQAAEYLGFCYASQYGLPVMNARLTQTFGAGIPKDDTRVFAQFARNVIEGKDIVLHTEGKSSKPYCYTTDCVSAILHILLKGEKGVSYNVATPGTYVSIRELAEVFRDCVNPGVDIRVETVENAGYAPDTFIDLNSDRLQALGWIPRYSLREMVKRLAAYLREEE